MTVLALCSASSGGGAEKPRTYLNHHGATSSSSFAELDTHNSAMKA
jgi:hypothetical protein